MGEKHWLLDMMPDRDAAERDIETLSTAMRPARLGAEHPFKVAWDTPGGKSQVLLTHLADDVRATAPISGVESLLKLMRNDAEGFSDFRYELRVAAALARAPGQRVLVLAGTKKGPDIEFCSQSQHTCGVACYRARSDPPNVKALRAVSQRVADGARRAFTFSPLSVSFCVEIVLDSVPVTAADEKLASDLAYRLLTEPRCPPELTDGAVRARRLPLPDGLLRSGDLRCVRLRFLYAIGAFEEARIAAHLDGKVALEENAWASSYAGIPLLAIEASDGAGDDGLHPVLQQRMQNSREVFAGAFLTYYPANGVEGIKWIPRQGGSLGFHIEYRTARPNMNTWADGNPVVTIRPEHSREDWDLFQTPAGSGSELVESLHIGAHHVRLPAVEDPTNPTADPNYQRNVETAIARIRAEDQKYPRGTRGVR